MNSLFEEVKARVNVLEAARRYGLELDRRGWCRCPFHAEKTASFHVSQSRNRWKCFGCGEGGDVIALVSRLLHISPLEAARDLDQTFRLELGDEVSAVAGEEWQNRQEAKRRHNVWAQETFNSLARRCRALRQIISTQAPRTPYDAVSDAFAGALKEIDWVEDLLDVLTCGTEEERRGARLWIDAYLLKAERR